MIEGIHNDKLYRWHGEWLCESCRQTAWGRTLTNDRTCPECGSDDLTPIWEPAYDARNPHKAYRDIADISLTP